RGDVREQRDDAARVLRGEANAVDEQIGAFAKSGPQRRRIVAIHRKKVPGAAARRIAPRDVDVPAGGEQASRGGPADGAGAAQNQCPQPNLASERARRFSASTSRFFGGAVVTRSSSRCWVMWAISATARSKTA